MPARTLPPALRRHPALLAAAVFTAAVVVAVAATIGGGSGTAAVPPGPTATASARELATTLETTGVVERINERTISYAGDRAVSAAAGTGAAAPAPADRTDVGPATTTATPTPAADTATTTTTTTAAPATTTTAAPATDAGSDETTTTAAPQPGPSACPAAESETTAPAACSTAPATVPTTSAPSTTTTTTPAAAANARPATTAPAQPATTTALAEADEVEDPVVLTTVAAAGSEVGRNTVLYSADDEPVVALIGTVPAWRAFETGMDGGADVRQLEENLTELGYGAGVGVDDDFTAATAAAVKRWEAAVGRADPDGVVDAGDVVFLAEPGRVLGLEAAVGDPLEAGTPVLVVGTRQQVVTGTVAVTEAAAWGAGTEVALEWSDGTGTAGTVSSTGTEVTDGRVALVVALSDADSLRPTGALVIVSTVGARAGGAVAVPVAAVIAGPGGKAAVRQAVAGEKADRVVPVTTGIVAGGWVEIRSGLEAGDEVRLPG